MEEKRFFYAPVKAKRALQELDKIWDHTVKPFRVAPHVWSIGCNDDVSVHLLDSGDGLILLDTGMEQYLHLVVNSIWSLGFNPKDIKMILLGHYHGDHTNGVRLLKEMCGAKVYLSKEDEVQHQLHKDDVKPMRTLPYEVDSFFDDNKPVKLGHFTIETKLVPGHTPGCTAFFFDDMDEETGETFHVAMHGGLGAATMKPEVLERNGYPEELAHIFIKDCYELAERKVDIALASHLNHGNIEPNIPEDGKDYRGFVADYAWHDILIDRADCVKSYYPDKYQVLT